MIFQVDGFYASSRLVSRPHGHKSVVLSVNQQDLVDMILKNPQDADMEELCSRVDELEADYSATVEGRDALFGDYVVERTFNSKNLGKTSDAAGGKWVRKNSLTSMLGKLDGLYQNVVKDDNPNRTCTTLAINQVLLSLLCRLICFTIVLRGECDFLSAVEREEIASSRSTPGGLSANAVRAKFGSPMIRISLLGYRSPLALVLRLGPRSSVILDASYCDDRLRVGKGASGVRFILRKVTRVSEAGLWMKVVNSKLVVGKKGIVGGLFAAGTTMLTFGGGRWKKVVGGIAVTAALAVVKSTGGLEEGEQGEV